MGSHIPGQWAGKALGTLHWCLAGTVADIYMRTLGIYAIPRRYMRTLGFGVRTLGLGCELWGFGTEL